MHDDIERILADEEEITPSSALLISVMEAVEREAAAPRPLEFPWVRALPGFLASFAALIAATWHGIGSLSDPAAVAALAEQARAATALAADLGVQWVILAVAITLVSVLLPSSLRRGGSRAWSRRRTLLR